MSLTEAIDGLRQTHIEHVILPLLVQLTIIVLAARVFGQLFRILGQSPVVGEIAAGIVLGPSLLGQIPLVEAIFHPQLTGVPPELSDEVFRWIFTTLGQLGLILLLFLVGLEFDFRHLRTTGRTAFWISCLGTSLPFVIGVAIAPWIFKQTRVDDGGSSTADSWVFALFIGTALSITALPVLARILVENRLQKTVLGTVVITAAAAGDAVGWILLAGVSATAQASFDGWILARMFVWSGLFVLVVYFVGRPFATRLVHRSSADHGEISVNTMSILIALLFACAIATSWIGIFAVIGAFLLGAVLSGEDEFRRKVEQHLHTFVTAFFLPVFFTYTGMRTRIQVLDSWDLWLVFATLLAVAIAGKMIGCGLAARFNGFGWRQSLAVGTLMNTRGLMELIVANVGYDLGVLPESVYCMLVLLALLTTLMTTPLLHWLVPVSQRN